MNYFKQFKKLLDHPLNKNQKIKTLFKIIWWKINQIFFKWPILISFVDDLRIICETENSYGSFIVYAKWPEYDELNFIYQYLKSDSVYIDVGAHIGSEILIAASKIKNGQIYGFEPTKKIFNKLKLNLKINNLNNIKIYQNLISDKNGYEHFVLESESEINHIISSKNNKKNNNIKKIKSITLDKFINKNKIKFIDLIKIDVEGAEYKVLKGLKQSLKQNKIKIILFELNKNIYNFNSSPEEIFKFLNNYNFKIYKFNQNKLKKLNIHKFKLNKTINLLAIHQI